MDGTFTGSLPSAFLFLGELLFKWVPGTVIAVMNVGPSATTTAPIFNGAGGPLPVWSVPALLEQSASPGAYGALVQGWFIFTLVMMTASIPFVALIVYCLMRVVQIRRRERRAFRAYQHTVKTQDIPKTQLRWRRIIDQAGGSTPEGWRLAILEADIMLNELLDLQGYKGETMADKMKQVDRAGFNTIDDAWEAHKVRNRIAHEGTAHELNPREVRRVVALYERVFKEFKFLE